VHAIEGRYHALAKERIILLRCESLEPPMSQLGPNSVVPVMSAARPFFPRKRTSIRDLAMSQIANVRHSDHRRTTL
jgi:hypothetical protein